LKSEKGKLENEKFSGSLDPFEIFNLNFAFGIEV
jgi:hypothetical protein